MGVGAEGHAKGASEAEVADFEVAVFVDEEILGFQVAVEDTVGVAVAHARDELVGELLDLENINTLISHAGSCVVSLKDVV